MMRHRWFGEMMPTALYWIRFFWPVYAKAFLVGAALGLILLPLLIGWQRKRRMGQHIYESGPQAHYKKQGTPTLGGVAFLAAALAGLVVELAYWYPLNPSHRWWLDPKFRGAIQVTALVLAVGVVGLVDDALILLRRRPLGLRARWKFTLIGLIAFAYVAWMFWPAIRGYGAELAWFGGGIVVPAWVAATLAFVAILGSTNAVNLTDGLDGLAAGTLVAPLFVLSLLFRPAGFLIAGAVLGALVIFLWFNRQPARIFMGDTGSLALGALIAGLASQGLTLLLPFVGFVFVVEALSVIAQVMSFKTTGKRIFKMSPLHHHFELLGWSERKITGVFIACSSSAAALTWYFAIASNAQGSK